MQGAAAQGGVVFFDFQLLGFQLFVASRGVARGRFAFFARFGAFNGNDFSGHDYSFSLTGFSSASSSSSNSVPPELSTVPNWPSRRWRRAPSRSSWLCASTVNRVQGIASRRLAGMVLPVSSQTP